MVFELTDTLIDDVVFKNEDYKHSLNNLFLGYAEGNLLLSASPELLDFLSTGLDDSLSKRVINHLQHKALVRYNVLWQTKVVLNNPNVHDHEIAIDFFRQSSAIQPPIVLCENLKDTEFYFALCREYFGEVFINTKNGQGGGGSSVADSLEHIVVSNDRFCLCIVDSDMKFPGAKEGGTYKAISNKGLEPSSTYHVHKLNVHEIENLIPIDFMCQHIRDNRVRSFAKRLKGIDKNGDILSFYDVKKGINSKNIREERLYYDFAEIIYNRLKKASDRTTFEQYLSKKFKNDCVFIPLCPSILTSFMNIKCAKKPRFEYCDYLKTEWECIWKLIVTFLCVRQNDPIN